MMKANLYIPRWMQLLLTLQEYKNPSVYRLSRIANTTYSHTTKEILKMQKADLLRTWKIGRVRRIEITLRGMKFRKALQELGGKK